MRKEELNLVNYCIFEWNTGIRNTSYYNLHSNTRGLGWIFGPTNLFSFGFNCEKDFEVF